ncbi:MAG: aminotransferase class V-fold PLP-dependent enzyme, partial [Myxococcota bacterium]
MMPVYLDHAATTPVDPRVLEAMLPFFRDAFGNAASRAHAYGWNAARAVDSARDQVTALIGARSPREIVFTSGATEANNLALKGLVRAGDHIVTGATEHKAVLDPCRRLEAQGCGLTVLDPDGQGRIAAEQVTAALTPRTRLDPSLAVGIEHGEATALRFEAPAR